MVVGWRICKAKYAASAFDGEGAFRNGGRWNSVGTRVVYLSSTLSLAALETRVHLNPLIPLRYVRFRVEFDDDLVETLEPSRWPPDWQAQPPALASQVIGDRWVRAARSPVLAVPSVLIDVEYNLLLNPNHGDFPRVAISEPKAFAFDPRLLVPGT